MLIGGFFEDSNHQESPNPTTFLDVAGKFTFDEDQVIWDPNRQLFITAQNPMTGASFCYDPWSAAQALSKAGIALAENAKEMQEMKAKLDKLSSEAVKSSKSSSKSKSDSDRHTDKGGHGYGHSENTSSSGIPSTPEVSGVSEETVDSSGEAKGAGEPDYSPRDYSRPEDTDTYTYSWSDSDGDWVPVHK